MSSQHSDREIRTAVRESYAKVALRDACDTSQSSAGCCVPASDTIESQPAEYSAQLGYSAEEQAAVPEGANMGLGCGNPQAIAALKTGETVLDLGSGGGFDVFLASRQIGDAGHVIGVDMTPEMLEKARDNAVRGGYANVEFRLGEIEHLPVADNSVDVILSNCVINLSTDKPAVFREAFRVLKSGGRLAISDVVATVPLTDELQNDVALHTGCMGGAETIDTLESILGELGFTAIQIQPKDASRAFIREWAPGRKLEDYIVSATIEAIKP